MRSVMPTERFDSASSWYLPSRAANVRSVELRWQALIFHSAGLLVSASEPAELHDGVHLLTALLDGCEILN